MEEIRFVLNGVEQVWYVEPDEYLADTLRNHGVKSVRTGCHESACGSCTVLVDNKPVLSCSYLSVRANGKNILTVEGIQDEAYLLSDYVSDQGADQCGFCASGLALIVHALKNEYKNPTDEQIKDFLVGNLCRCSGYQAQFIAVKKYLAKEAR